MDNSGFSYENKKRVFTIGFILVFIIFLLILRLFWIQIVMGKDYSKKAVQQRLMGISLSSGRGDFYDRNFIPFTSREDKNYIIAYPSFIHDKNKAAEIIGESTGISKDMVKEKLDSKVDILEFLYSNDNMECFELIQKGKLKGVIALEKKVRYDVNSLCKHVIGYIGKAEKRGEMGLEKSMDSYLYNGDGSSVIAVVDSSKNIIPGLGFRKVEKKDYGKKLSIKLTLDYHIQRIVEDVMRERELNGAVVVIDIKNGDILAMASYPDYDQNNVQNYINSDGEELINKTIWPYDLGSVFKTVVVAAALESDDIDLKQRFLCEGVIDTGNSEIKCSTYKTHEDREINIEEAFALSCNTAFVKIGTELGAERILNMAKKFGLGDKQCVEIFEEKLGYIPEANEEGIGNISIGQGKIQVTPLQVTSMMATIANNGIKNPLRLVDELIDEKGNVVKSIERLKPEAILSKSTAYKLQSMLNKVVLYGTGKSASLNNMGGAAGKTGTAETGINFGRVKHGWFSGYFPAVKPRYAVTVFVNDGKSGGAIAAPVFRDIAERILKEI